jgi:hypothetical protein
VLGGNQANGTGQGDPISNGGGTMNRVKALLTVVALTPLIMGAGGIEPGPPLNTTVAGPVVSGIIVMDPHMPGVTTHAKQASIWLQNGWQTAAAVFRVPRVFALFRGCDPSLTTLRFVNTSDRNNRLDDWIPADVVATLFSEAGITVDETTNFPVITNVIFEHCTPDLDNPGPLLNEDGSSSAPGILSLRVNIQFRVPQ